MIRLMERNYNIDACFIICRVGAERSKAPASIYKNDSTYVLHNFFVYLKYGAQSLKWRQRDFLSYTY